MPITVSQNPRQHIPQITVKDIKRYSVRYYINLIASNKEKQQTFNIEKQELDNI